MLTDKMLKALNDQIQMEFSSAYLYLAMAAQCEHENLPGFAQWLKVQYQEEVGHGMKLFNYVGDRGGRVTLQAIEQPAAEFGTVSDMFQQVLEHERKVSASISNVYEVALAEKDYPTQAQLHWFLTEQVEEEKTAEEILRQLEAMEGKAHLMLMMDRRMGQRQPAAQ